MHAMRFKGAVNSVLYRGTGLRFTSETPEQRRDAIKRAKRNAARAARERTTDRLQQRALKRETRHQEQLAQQKQRLEEWHRAESERQATRRSHCDPFPRYLDEVKGWIIATANPRTMTDVSKLDALMEAIRYVTRHGIAGEIVECVDDRGGNTQVIALTLMSIGDTSRELHLFDIREGMPPPTADDMRERKAEAIISAGDTAPTDEREMAWAVASTDGVREGMAETAYPEGMVHHHVGTAQEATGGKAPEQIAILRLATAPHALTQKALETLYERLSPGGVLMIDDYADRASKAINEWPRLSSESLFLVPLGPGRIAVKPVSGSAKCTQ